MLKSFFHTGFIVKDIDKSIDFYTSVFGMSLAGRGERSGPFAETLLGYSEAHLQNAFLELGEGHQLELIQYLTPTGSRAQFEKNDLGASHLAFLVEDIETFYTQAKANGLKPVNPPVSLHDENGKLLRKALYAQDPDGNWIELVELF
ncbi:MAG: hypothetical protein CMG13_07765 [Candidatus Marinimicrobia bacterium]|nr:hypothetical protein [Candidatus Neomarinimicrobiota bacterium]|tara:strand:+ start:1461 stop:1901 length:441 start_codon:yes stop_codon:yes gene_type:complete